MLRTLALCWCSRLLLCADCANSERDLRAHQTIFQARVEKSAESHGFRNAIVLRPTHWTARNSMTNSSGHRRIQRKKKKKQLKPKQKLQGKKTQGYFEITLSISSLVGAQTIGLFGDFQRYCIRELEKLYVALTSFSLLHWYHQRLEGEEWGPNKPDIDFHLPPPPTLVSHSSLLPIFNMHLENSTPSSGELIYFFELFPTK